MSARFLGIGRDRARLRDRAKRYESAFNQKEDVVESMLDRITNMADKAYGNSNMSTEERFGNQIQSQTDGINQNKAGAQNAIQTALMASGGDVSGSGAVTLGKITQGANEAVGNVKNYYDERNEDANRYEASRGDSLNFGALQGQQGLMNMNLSQLLNTEQLEMMRKQANRQLIGDIIGGAAAVGGAALSDKRAKKNIKYIDNPSFEEKTGVKLATWQWKGSGETAKGVIAQDLQKVHPELVHPIGNGMLGVDYTGIQNLL